ncbi:YhgE/Pip domain-containing protein [Actinopolyspora mortivallis]|uniref:YhgE/Pip domain-containing protein n=1 Tax=Actinopolyspora mortivallis TaxID=33906 RepID=UPI0003672525|nr:YhgE/Pip domain-containing protein [Actinopolyspora mortivallis]
MTTFRLAKTELRRLTSGKLPKLALVAVTLVPLLYGALYIYANWDPYGNLETVPAAVAVEDTGATRDDGSQLTAGEDVYQNLTDSGDFDWHRVSGEQAHEGVSEGTYTFALVIPRDFSRALLSPGEFEPEQARLRLITNDANNYLAGTIADKVVSRVRETVSADAGSDAARELLLGLSTVHDQTVRAADGAGDLADGAGDLDTGLDQTHQGTQQLLVGQRKLAQGADELATASGRIARGNSELHDGLSQMRNKTADLPKKTDQLADGAERVAEGNAELAEKASEVGEISQGIADRLDGVRGDVVDRLRGLGLSEEQIERVTESLEQLDQPLDEANSQVQQRVKRVQELSDGSQRVARASRELANNIPQLTNGIKELDAASEKLAGGARQVHEGATELRDKQREAVSGAEELNSGVSRLSNGSDQLVNGSHELADKLGTGAEDIPNPDESTREATAKTIGDPVAVDETAQTDAGTYGAGLAPYFMGLALWIGGFVLFLLMRPLSNRALASGVAPWRTALGGWLPAALVGTIQAVLLYSVVVFGIGVDTASPWWTLGLLILTSLAFTAVVHSLNAAFGPKGKFLALVFLVLQLITAGGTFPWQSTPEVLHPLHKVLPLGYVVDGLRHLIYGGSADNAIQAALVLLCYLVCGLLLSTVAAMRQRVWTASRLRPELSL